jgi:hypothetical protein
MRYFLTFRILNWGNPMAFDPITAVFSVGEKLIDKLLPDPAAKAKALQDMAELKQSGDLAFLSADVALLTGQMEINKLEAQHGGLFKGGWRPFVGWTCGVALAYKFVIQPFLLFTVQLVAHMFQLQLFPVDMLPVIEWSELSVILLGMLGLGTMRSYEKTQG